jgi:hypothetical protein
MDECCTEIGDRIGFCTYGVAAIQVEVLTHMDASTKYLIILSSRAGTSVTYDHPAGLLSAGFDVTLLVGTITVETSSLVIGR